LGEVSAVRIGTLSASECHLLRQMAVDRWVSMSLTVECPLLVVRRQAFSSVSARS
jgi:hypothetical protein